MNLVNITDQETFSTSGGSISTIDSTSILASSESSNGTNNLIAYRPAFSDCHNSNLGVLFFNMLGIFPCLQEAHRTNFVHISCFPTTAEDDGFLGGRAIIHATDIGNGLVFKYLVVVLHPREPSLMEWQYRIVLNLPQNVFQIPFKCILLQIECVSFQGVTVLSLKKVLLNWSKEQLIYINF